ncbi:hypothetical protein AJ87_48390 [Rhizobium yanglingense]|nr:hypothetical protein AJ87_48390 [Rhizobium yanglingense]
MSGPIGADHYLVVLDVREDRVEMHDPQGFPYASLPLSDFMAGWRAETLDYGTPYTMRTNFRQVRQVKEEGIIRSSLPAAIEWLSMETAQKVPEVSLGNADAAFALPPSSKRVGVMTCGTISFISLSGWECAVSLTPQRALRASAIPRLPWSWRGKPALSDRCSTL